MADGVAVLPELICDAGDARAADVVPVGLDAATTDYVLSMRAPFDLLHRSVSQLAGLMILAAAGSKSGIPEPMLERAVEARIEAEDAIRSARVPPRSTHHHRHLQRANRALAAALKAAGRGAYRRDVAMLDAVLIPLRAANAELQHAVGALPGLEMVALSQACCARLAREQSDEDDAIDSKRQQ